MSLLFHILAVSIARLLRRKPDVEFFTRTPADECLRRLSEAVGQRKWFWGFQPGKPIGGWIRKERFYLYKHIYYRNSFMPFLYGNLTPTPHGTYVWGVFVMHPFVLIFLILWFGIFTSSAFQGLYRSLTEPAFSVAPWLFLAIIFGAGLFVAVMVYVGEWLERGSKEYLKQFLYKTLTASELRRPPTVTLSKTPNFKLILTATLVGILFLVPKVIISFARPLIDALAGSTLRDFLYRLTIFAEMLCSGIVLYMFLPVLTGFMYAYLITRRSPLVHPLNALLGGMISSSLLGLIAGILDHYGRYVLTYFRFGITTGFEPLSYGLSGVALLMVFFAMAGTVGSQLGWLALAKKEVT